jgi:hypothetical protein
MTGLMKASIVLGVLALICLFLGAIGPGLALLVLTVFVGYLAERAV